MLSWLMQSVRAGRRSGAEAGMTHSVSRAEGGRIQVAFRRAVLRASHVAWACDDVRDSGARQVTFDFSDVTTLDGPWGVQFAQLKAFARETGVTVSVSGLTGHCAAMALVFRDDAELREMVLRAAADSPDDGTLRAA